MTQYPWWGVPLIAGLFALAGVLLTQFVTVRINNQKFIRETEVQWNNEKRRIYSEFLAVCAQALVILAAARKGDVRESTHTIDALKLSLLAYEMQLVASRELSVHATNLSLATQRVVETSKNTPFDSELYEHVREEAIQASTKFIECARGELATAHL